MDITLACLADLRTYIYALRLAPWFNDALIRLYATHERLMRAHEVLAHAGARNVRQTLERFSLLSHGVLECFPSTVRSLGQRLEEAVFNCFLIGFENRKYWMASERAFRDVMFRRFEEIARRKLDYLAEHINYMERKERSVWPDVVRRFERPQALIDADPHAGVRMLETYEPTSEDVLTAMVGPVLEEYTEGLYPAVCPHALLPKERAVRIGTVIRKPLLPRPILYRLPNSVPVPAGLRRPGWDKRVPDPSNPPKQLTAGPFSGLGARIKSWGWWSGRS